MRDWIQICQDCHCLSEECLGFRLYLCFQDFFQNVVRRFLIMFCFLQPVTLVLISMANQWRKTENTASTVIVCALQTNYSSFEYKNSVMPHDKHDEGGVGVNIGNLSEQCMEVDYLLVCMPHALAVSICTLIWLRLIGNGVLYESLTWDDGVYSSGNGAIFLYDLSYYFEVLSMNVFFIFLTVQAAHGWAAYYVSISLTLVMIYFVHVAHYKAETQLDAMAAMVGSTVMALILIPFFLDLLETRSVFTTAVMVLHLFCVILIVCGHYVSAGEATAAYVLSLRVFVTVCTCLINIVLVASGVNRLRH